MYTCQCEGCQMGQSSGCGVLFMEAGVCIFGGVLNYVYNNAVEPLIMNSPNSENLFITDCFCGTRSIAVLIKQPLTSGNLALYNKLVFRSERVRYREVPLHV